MAEPLTFAKGDYLLIRVLLDVPLRNGAAQVKVRNGLNANGVTVQVRSEDIVNVENSPIQANDVVSKTVPRKVPRVSAGYCLTLDAKHARPEA